MDRQPPPDLSLAIDGGTRRMTYAELADVRGISAASAERLVRRRKWSRQVGNDGVARVLVPLEEARKIASYANRSRSGQSPDIRTVAPDIRPDILPGILPAIREVIREVVDPLFAQLDHERRRADDAVAAERIAAIEAVSLRAELDGERSRADGATRLLEEEQQRSGKLEASLADAVGAERIAAGEAAALRAELDRRRDWGPLRRLRWALRGDRN
jgi:hypothetical protein